MKSRLPLPWNISEGKAQACCQCTCPEDHTFPVAIPGQAQQAPKVRAPLSAPERPSDVSPLDGNSSSAQQWNMHPPRRQMGNTFRWHTSSNISQLWALEWLTDDGLTDRPTAIHFPAGTTA